MKVKILFFGATAEAVGERETNFELGETANAESAFAQVMTSFPALKKFEKNLLFAVNQEYASGAEIIRDGDELAVFTAVSGG